MNHDDPAFDVSFALRHKLSPKIKWKDENASKHAARTILEHLHLCGWELVKRPPQRTDGTPEYKR